MNRVGPYEIVSELGRGGMGVVYRARRDGEDADVALKVIAAGEDASVEALARFQREARIAQELDHPGIVKVLETGDADGQVWFAMELVEGEPLSKQIREREFTWEEAVTIVRDVADALAVAHEKGVLHRDIKPSNILMDAGGRPHLTDFGLAKDTRTESKYTRTGQTLGTPAYMSPEQAKGDLAQLTPASDVWALGCVLYECLAGRPAFVGDTPAAIIGHVVSGHPEPLPGLPNSCSSLLWVMLRKDCLHRPAQASAVRDAASALLEGRRPVLPRGPTASVVPAIFAVVAAGLVGAGTWWWQSSDSVDRPVAAVRTAAQDQAERAWAVRNSDADLAERLLREALAAEAGHDDWRTRLGLLLWARGADAMAEKEWEAIAEESPHYSRALWLRGLCAYGRGLGRRDRRLLGSGAALWRRAAALGGDSAGKARVGIALAEYDVARARDAIGGEQGWEAELLRGLTENVAAAAHQPARGREAIRAYDRALRDGVVFAWALSNRAVFLIKEGREAEAARDLEQALAIAPDSPSALVNRGWLHLRGERFQAAQRDLDRACRLAPSLDDAWYQRGLLLRARGRLEPALADLNRAHALSPGRAHVLISRATILSALGRLHDAAADLSAVIAGGRSAAKAYAMRADARSRLGDHDGALSDIRRACELQPDNPEYLAGRARYLTRTDLAAARADGDRAATLAPDSARVQFALGLVCYREGRLEEAERAYGRCIELDPRDRVAFDNRAAVRIARGDLLGALADTEAACAGPALTARPLRNRLFVFRRLKDDSAALAVCERILAIEPDDAFALFHRGQLRRSAGDLDGALADQNVVLHDMPEDPSSRLERAHVYRAQGRLRDAAVDVEFGFRSEDAGERRTAHLLRARLSVDRGAYREALADCDAALRLTPGDDEALARRASVWAALGDESKALEDYTRAADVNTKLFWVYHERGRIFERRGRLEAAEADFSRALQANSAVASTWYHRAVTRRRRGNFDGARADFDAAIDRNPTFGLAYGGRGAIRSRFGDHAGALADFRQALACDPELAEQYVNIGATLLKLGKPAEAARAFREFLKQAPNHRAAPNIRRVLAQIEQRLAGRDGGGK